MIHLKEAELKKQVTDYLERTDLVWWRVPLGGVMQAGGKFKSKNPMAGFPDLCGLIAPTGKLWGLELKTTGGKISPVQMARIHELQGAGALIDVCYDFAQAKKFIDFLKSY